MGIFRTRMGDFSLLPLPSPPGMSHNLIRHLYKEKSMSADLGYFLTVHEQCLKFQFCQKPQIPIFVFMSLLSKACSNCQNNEAISK